MWGTCSPDRVCTVAKQRGYDRIALTDTNCLYGLWPFLKSCERLGMTPIIGAELTDAVSDRRAVCLVENDRGYRNLCRLITRRHSDEAFDLASAIPIHADGLFIITQFSELLADWYAAGVAIEAGAPRRPNGAAFRLRQTARHLGISMVATPYGDPDAAVIFGSAAGRGNTTTASEQTRKKRTIMGRNSSGGMQRSRSRPVCHRRRIHHLRGRHRAASNDNGRFALLNSRGSQKGV